MKTSILLPAALWLAFGATPGQAAPVRETAKRWAHAYNRWATAHHSGARILAVDDHSVDPNGVRYLDVELAHAATHAISCGWLAITTTPLVNPCLQIVGGGSVGCLDLRGDA